MNNKICSYADKIPAFTEGDLCADEMAGMEKHLNECEECSIYLKEMNSLTEELRTLPLVSVSDEFTDKVMNRIKQEKIGRAYPGVQSYIIGIILASVVFGIYSLLSRPGYSFILPFSGLLGSITTFLSEPLRAEALAIIITGVWSIISSASPFIIANLFIIAILVYAFRNKKIPVSIETA